MKKEITKETFMKFIELFREQYRREEEGGRALATFVDGSPVITITEPFYELIWKLWKAYDKDLADWTEYYLYEGDGVGGNNKGTGKAWLEVDGELVEYNLTDDETLWNFIQVYREWKKEENIDKGS